MRKETAVIVVCVAAVAGFFVGTSTRPPGDGGGVASAAGSERAPAPSPVGAAEAGARRNEDPRKGRPPPRRAAPDPNRVYEIAADPRAPRKGGRNTRVVIQQFSDFQCPYCSRVEPTMARLLEKYGDRIAIVWRNFPLPFHDHAMLAAEAALEAHAQGRFWPMHALIFENQRALERADLERHAEQIGLDMRRFRAALDGHTHRAAIEADMQASRASGARHGTPAFFINGRLLQGALPVEAFEAAVDRALADGGRQEERR